MRQIILYIAVSLDGYIADAEGGVGWLNGDGSQAEHPGSYADFIQGVDTVLLGNTTYTQIITELSPETWPYADKACYVFSRTKHENTENVTFCTENPIDFVQKLKNAPGKDIWLCGGAKLCQSFMEANLIDVYCLTIVPTLLGGGVPLFAPHTKELTLSLQSSTTYNGMVDVVYVRRKI